MTSLETGPDLAITRFVNSYQISTLLLLFSHWVTSDSFVTSFEDCSPPGISVHGISQARILEWAAIPFSRLNSSSLLYIWLQLLILIFLIFLPPSWLYVTENWTLNCLGPCWDLQLFYSWLFLQDPKKPCQVELGDGHLECQELLPSGPLWGFRPNVYKAPWLAALQPSHKRWSRCPLINKRWLNRNKQIVQRKEECLLEECLNLVKMSLNKFMWNRLRQTDLGPYQSPRRPALSLSSLFSPQWSQI